MTGSHDVADSLERAVIEAALDSHKTVRDRYAALYQRDVVQIALRSVRNVTPEDPATHEEMKGMLNGILHGTALMFAMYVPAESHRDVVKDFGQRLAVSAEAAKVVYGNRKVVIVP